MATQVITPVTALVVAVGSVVGAIWWGRNRIEALQEQLRSKDGALAAKDEQIKALKEALGSKDIALAAKDEQIKAQKEALISKDVVLGAKDEQIKTLYAEIAMHDRMKPSDMVQRVEGLKEWYQLLADQASERADAAVHELTTATEQKRENLEQQLESSRLTIRTLEERIVVAEQAAEALRRMDIHALRAFTRAQLEAGWRHEVLDRLSKEAKSAFEHATPEFDGLFLTVTFWKPHQSEETAEYVGETIDLVRAWLGPATGFQMANEDSDGTRWVGTVIDYGEVTRDSEQRHLRRLLQLDASEQ